jgi:hypothetical protein
VGDSATRIKHKGNFAFQSLIDNATGKAIINTLEVSSHVIIACTPEGAIVRSDVPQHLKDKVRRSYARMIETVDFDRVDSEFCQNHCF